MCKQLTRDLRQTPQRAPREGSLLLETLVALALLSVVLVLAAQMGTSMLRHRKFVQSQSTAFETKNNLMTFAMAIPYDQLTEPKLLEYAKQLTPNQRDVWQIRIQEITETEKQISVDISSRKRTSQSSQPLVAWRHQIKNNSKAEDVQ